jgi:20S proteasome alpha/beta subunit
VLGADTRATEGDVVRTAACAASRQVLWVCHDVESLSCALQIADKCCEKIHYMAPNIRCCGAGTAADTEHITDLMCSQLELLRLATGTESRVVTAMTLLKRRLFQ